MGAPRKGAENDALSFANDPVEKIDAVAGTECWIENDGVWVPAREEVLGRLSVVSDSDIGPVFKYTGDAEPE